MPRTFGGLYLQDAVGCALPSTQIGTGAGLWQLTRNAANDVSWNNVAGVATSQIYPDFSILTRPYIAYPAEPGQGNTIFTSNEYQSAFGTAAGGPSNPFSGVPPSSNALAASVFGTPPVPWGLALLDVFAVYSVQTAALTAATLQVNRLQFAEGVALVNTATLAATGIALTTTASATTCHVQKVALAQPLVFEMGDFTDLSIELVFTTAATSAVRLYGIGCHAIICYT